MCLRAAGAAYACVWCSMLRQRSHQGAYACASFSLLLQVGGQVELVVAIAVVVAICCRCYRRWRVRWSLSKVTCVGPYNNAWLAA